MCWSKPVGFISFLAPKSLLFISPLPFARAKNSVLNQQKKTMHEIIREVSQKYHTFVLIPPKWVQNGCPPGTLPYPPTIAVPNLSRWFYGFPVRDMFPRSLAGNWMTTVPVLLEEFPEITPKNGKNLNPSIHRSCWVNHPAAWPNNASRFAGKGWVTSANQLRWQQQQKMPHLLEYPPGN